MSSHSGAHAHQTQAFPNAPLSTFPKRSSPVLQAKRVFFAHPKQEAKARSCGRDWGGNLPSHAGVTPDWSDRGGRRLAAGEPHIRGCGARGRVGIGPSAGPISVLLTPRLEDFSVEFGAREPRRAALFLGLGTCVRRITEYSGVRLIFVRIDEIAIVGMKLDPNSSFLITETCSSK